MAMIKTKTKLPKVHDRIDINEQGVDDVVIKDVDMFRLERMDENCFWLCCYRGNKRVTFNIFKFNDKSHMEANVIENGLEIEGKNYNGKD